jgi:hypothetical protein
MADALKSVYALAVLLVAVLGVAATMWLTRDLSDDAPATSNAAIAVAVSVFLVALVWTVL